MIKCKYFEMWGASISQLFGKSPKITYICGECGHYNEGRIPMMQLYMDDPYLICDYCNEKKLHPY